jgi:hypothetical protein
MKESNNGKSEVTFFGSMRIDVSIRGFSEKESFKDLFVILFAVDVEIFAPLRKT